MPLEKAKCTNCGANLEVDSSKDAAVCPFCNTAYIVEKAINNYTTNITNNNDAQTANILSQKEDFEIIDGVLKKYTGIVTDITIPKEVKSIECNALPKNITSVVIEPGVSVISERAFEDCRSLTHVLIPNSVTEISHCAFKGCTSLTNVAIPNSVTKIGFFTFRDCTSLTSVTIPDSVDVIGIEAFKGCTNLTSVTIPNSVTTICSSAFEDCTSLTNVTIPDSVTGIGSGAFRGCTSLTNIRLPAKVQIVTTAFDNCPALTYTAKIAIAKKTFGCYIATCVYGSYDCPQVWTLRRFRDDMLASTWYGRAFVRAYYVISPTLVKWFGNTVWFRRLWQGKLDKIVNKLNDRGVENTPYQDKQW